MKIVLTKERGQDKISLRKRKKGDKTEMYNEKKLRLAMLQADMTVAQLANEVGISESALYRKIKGKTEFTLSEMQDICRILGIQGGGIFFDSELA